MSTTTINNRPGYHAHLVAIHRAGLDAAATPETPQNRIARGRVIRAGERALDELLGDLDGLLQFFVKRYARSWHESEDLLQLARLHALQALRTWRPGAGSSVSTWVVTFLRKKLRSESLRIRPPLEELSEFQPGSSEYGRATASDIKISVIDEGEEMAVALERHRERLDDEDKEMLDQVMAGGTNAGGSMGRRSRVRALAAHPTSGIVVSGDDTHPIPRSSSPVDIGADIDALSRGRFPQPGWRVIAACNGGDTANFFPTRGEDYPAEVLHQCVSCPVRLDCLAVGIEASTWPGLWGGHSARTRRIVRRGVRNANGALAKFGV